MPPAPLDALKRLSPYLPDMAAALALLGELGSPVDGMRIDAALLSAIMLRETGAGLGWGYLPKGDRNGAGDATPRTWTRAHYEAHRDRVKILSEAPGGRLVVYPKDGRGWGRGLWQIDFVGDFAHLIPADGSDWPVLVQAQAAVRVLQAARRELAEFRGRPVFPMAVACRYNAGLPYVVAALREGRDPNTVTTPSKINGPGDYGSDVLSTRERLIADHPGVFSGGGLT